MRNFKRLPRKQKKKFKKLLIRRFNSLKKILHNRFDKTFSTKRVTLNMISREKYYSKYFPMIGGIVLISYDFKEK